jgi:hypothetical protein
VTEETRWDKLDTAGRRKLSGEIMRREMAEQGLDPTKMPGDKVAPSTPEGVAETSRVVNHSLSLSDVRAMASGWHFSKESLTVNEHKMLWVIEELLSEIDDGSGYAHHWPSEADPR